MALALQRELAALRVRVAELEALLHPGESSPSGSVFEVDRSIAESEVGSSLLLKEILASLPETLLVVGYDWRVVYTNLEAERRRGFKAGEALGENFWESWPELQAAKEMLWGAMESRVAARFEYAQDNDLWTEVHAFPCQAGLIVHSRDVTKRRKTEIIQDAMAAIIASSDDAIISKDLNGIVRSWNAGAERIFSYSAEETIGKPISILAAPGHEDEMPELLNRIRRGERVDHYQTKRQTKDGRIIAVSLTLSPIKNAAGEIVGASKVARDITESEKAERALEAANEALLRANADLEQFSSAAAHDLQEPLRMVAIYSEMLKRDYAEKLDARAVEYIKFCVEGAVKMQRLVRDLLEFSRATSLYDEHRPLTNLNTVLQKVLGNLEAAIAESGARIVHEELPEVRAHEILMQHLFQNLISNAIKYRNEQLTPVVQVGQ
jgi:PAS domain S-box-containing protein